MTGIRKEARAALQFVIDNGGTALSSQYHEYSGVCINSVNQCFVRLVDRGLLKTGISKRPKVYTVVDMEYAKGLASAVTKEDQARLKALAKVKPRRLPVSFVFNLGAQA